MTIRAFTFAALTVVAASGSATAGERIDFTPPLYREQARPTADVRPASEAPHPIVEVTAR